MELFGAFSLLANEFCDIHGGNFLVSCDEIGFYLGGDVGVL